VVKNTSCKVFSIYTHAHMSYTPKNASFFLRDSDQPLVFFDGDVQSFGGQADEIPLQND